MSEATWSPATYSGARGDGPMPWAAQHGLTLLLVAVAVVLGFAVERLVPAANLSLFFVLPVVIGATSFGWGPALTATIAGVLAYDYFFTVPYFSLTIASPADICDAVLLFVVAAIVSAVAADSRRKALEARRATEQSEALRAVAHAAAESRPEVEIAGAAALALNKIFRAPAAIFREHGGTLDLVAKAGAGLLGEADEDAARVSAASRVPTRANNYPSEAARFDFWPVPAGTGRSFVLGVDFSTSKQDRPAAAERYIELVGAYLAASLGAKRPEAT